MSSSELAEIQKQIEVHVTRETERYHQYKKKNLSADDKWMNDVIKSGTLSDKVAALALKVSSAPFHEMQTLDILLAMALKKEQRVSQLALEALKDLLVHNLLPDRKLIPFKSRDLVNAGLLDGMLYWFEDKLMQKFSSVLDALDGGIKSNVDFFKKTCLGIILDLLASKPEQEQRLLMMLVNKLGDHVASFSSNVTQHLKTLLSKHPAMKIVVAKEVRQFIFRANVSSKSLYSGICFLNQINLVTSDHKVAELLMEIFIQMFDKVVNDKDMSSKLLAALLTGINKSYPVLKNHDVIEKHIDTLFRVVHTGTFSASTQALSLISLMALDDPGRANKSRKASVAVEKSGSDGDLKSRYYRALYEKLLSEQVLLIPRVM
jgi:ribosome biogenesis protein MAK21